MGAFREPAGGPPITLSCRRLPPLVAFSEACFEMLSFLSIVGVVSGSQRGKRSGHYTRKVGPDLRRRQATSRRDDRRSRPTAVLFHTNLMRQASSEQRLCGSRHGTPAVNVIPSQLLPYLGAKEKRSTCGERMGLELRCPTDIHASV